jgi:predicted dehydrogenase/threonine dehydrogenase-like Zn-dependent dehydrogenase
MKQIVQPVGGGPVELLDVPWPVPDATEVLVRTLASVISPGTERAVTTLAQSSLLAKARARPDLVRQVVQKARTEGLTATRQAVRGRLAQDLPLGYSAAGVVLETGSAVTGIRPGQLVATGGAGKASHAEVQAVPALLCAPVPDGVDPRDAAITTIAAIALHGLRMAEVGPGARVLVVGLGLIGQLAARLALAAGCEVAGIDPDRHPRAVASAAGVLAVDEAGTATTDQVRTWSRGRGADAVLVCAAGRSSSIMAQVPGRCRDRAAVVIVGDVGLDLDRTPFYERELSVRFARSYGPGRYDPAYEAWGVDYPAGHVRWTEGRNFEAVLDLIAGGRLAVRDLVTHDFPIDRATEAYQLIEERPEPYLAIRLDYPGMDGPDRGVRVHSAPEAGGLSILPHSDGDTEPGVGWIGAGAFSTGTLLPALQAAGFARLVAVASAGGVSARRMAERSGFEQAVSGADAVLSDPDVGVVVIASPHDTHAELAARALQKGQHVWCEKPLALTEDELDEIEAAWRASGRVLAVGFNRRWSPAVAAARAALASVAAPKLITYRVAAGAVPDGHWYHDRRQGGRLLGEVCHFVDTAQALAGAPVEDVTALPGGGPGACGDDAVVALRFADGSLAAIGYGSATPTAGKEWIEVQAGSHRVVIDDFRSVTADGKRVWRAQQDKGHQGLATAFRQAVTGDETLPTAELLATMRATIRAAAARTTGYPTGNVPGSAADGAADDTTGSAPDDTTESAPDDTTESAASGVAVDTTGSAPGGVADDTTGSAAAGVADDTTGTSTTDDTTGPADD